jgi:hypothetical protein
MTEKMFHIKSPFVFEHKINSPAQLVGIDSKGLALVVFMTQPLHILFGLVRFAQTDHCRCPDGPFEMGVADFFVGFSSPFAVGFFFRTNQPSIGAKTLYRGKALNIVYLIQDDQRQNPAHTGNGSEQIEAVVVVLASNLFDLLFNWFDQIIKCLDHG